MLMQLITSPVSDLEAARCGSSLLSAEHERPLLTPGLLIFHVLSLCYALDKVQIV